MKPSLGCIVQEGDRRKEGKGWKSLTGGNADCGHHGNNLSPSDVEYNSGEGSPYNVGTEEEEEQDEVEPSADKRKIEEAEEHRL